MTLFNLEHGLMIKHLRVDGTGDAVVELGIELGKLVAGKKKRIISQKSGQEISPVAMQDQKYSFHQESVERKYI